MLFLFGSVGPHLGPQAPDIHSSAAALLARGILVDELYASAPDGAEYMSIVCTADEVLLDGWSVTDHEGTVTFTGGLVLVTGGRLVLSWSPTSYASAYGAPPAIGLDGTCGAGLFSMDGAFRLADDGDQIALLSPDGSVCDAVAYGDSPCPDVGWVGECVPAPRAGEVLKRVHDAGGLADTDSAADWLHFREHRYGYTSHSPVSGFVPAGGVTAFLSPECSLRCVLDEVRAAQESIRLCSYEFSSSDLCSELVSALGRGVSVSVLVDGSPAGGMSDDEVACLSVLAACGADVHEFTTAVEGSVRHVLALHPKYLVIDSRRSVVMSENLVDSGLPPDEVFGNRGWGVAFTSSFLAARLNAVFDDDSRLDRQDVLEWVLDPRNDPRAGIPPEDSIGPTTSFIGPFTSSKDAHVALYVSPDCSPMEPYLCRLIGSSTLLLAEQFQADAFWESRWTGLESPSPLVSSVGGMVSSGGAASVLLDSSWFNLERNAAAAEALCAAGADARLMIEASPVTVLHNKGLVLDGGLTVVSSNNWVSSSFARNRELAAVVSSDEVAAYFTAAFMLDWVPDSSPPLADAGQDVVVETGETVDLSALGSSDDRAIVSYAWDVGGDGSVEGEGATFELDRAYPGNLTVVLTVVDSWGNAGKDTITVSFRTDGGPGDATGTGSDLMGDIALATGLVVVTAIAVMRKTLIIHVGNRLSACRGRGSSRSVTSRGSRKSSDARSGRAIPRRCTSRSTTSGPRDSSSWRRQG